MKVLSSENQYGIKVPYIVVTSGCRKSEAEDFIQLSKPLNIDVFPRPTFINIHWLGLAGCAAELGGG